MYSHVFNCIKMSIVLDLRAIYWHFAGTPFIQPRLASVKWLIIIIIVIIVIIVLTMIVVSICCCYYEQYSHYYHRHYYFYHFYYSRPPKHVAGPCGHRGRKQTDNPSNKYLIVCIKQLIKYQISSTNKLVFQNNTLNNT